MDRYALLNKYKSIKIYDMKKIKKYSDNYIKKLLKIFIIISLFFVYSCNSDISTDINENIYIPVMAIYIKNSVNDSPITIEVLVTFKLVYLTIHRDVI